MKPGREFDPRKLHAAAARELPHYAMPVFVRVEASLREVVISLPAGN